MNTQACSPSAQVHGALRSAFRDSPASELIAPHPRVFVFVDVCNLLLGGASVQAARNGMAPTPKFAADNNIFDYSYRVDVCGLRHFLVGEDPNGVARTICFGSRRADSADSHVWDAWRRARWDVRLFVRSASGREKEVDNALGLEMYDELIFSGVAPSEAEITLVGGDRDHAPALRKLAQRGYRVDVVCWTHTLAAAVRQLARRVIQLDDYFDLLRY